ncbi:hypothetical protein ACH4S9_24830 [Streptomyces sp. NPDC021225]|uniref:hypothetical protein n=1 Tax=Streptomyces sp. NPDC021225 TaxID=3365121 RepID=UPI003790F0E6
MAHPYPLFAYLDAAPVEISTPAATGYTLRRYRDDEHHREPVFLGRDRAVFAFRSTANLVAFLRSEEPHDLVGTPDWEPPDWEEVPLVADIGLTYIRHEQLEVCRLDNIAQMFGARASMVDLDGAQQLFDVPPILFHPPLDKVLELMQTHHVARELAEYAGLAEAADALAPESPLATFERELGAAYFTKSGDHRELSRHDTDVLAALWSELVDKIVPVVDFRD